MTDELDLLSASDLADKADISPSYVARLCRQGKIRATKIGTVWLIRTEDAEAWLRERSKHQNED